jgi:membrane associated rhomboid family serine protease
MGAGAAFLDQAAAPNNRRAGNPASGIVTTDWFPTLTDVQPDEWIEVERYAQPSDAESAALVLAAAGIRSHLIRQGAEYLLFVPAANAPQAGSELVEYLRENARRPHSALRPASEGFGWALAYTAVLAFVNTAATRQWWGVDWLAAGHANAGLILEGEWWRTITALSLHGDLDHLASNAVAGAALGILLTQVLGPGLSWLSILVSAGIGNGVNALMQPADHSAIGASTAVFAALGLLAALRWRAEANWTRGLRRWLPLAAGVALLAFLGTGGERTDVGAHATGFVTGVGVGAAIHLAGERVPKGPAAQIAYGIAAAALFGVAWLLAVTA